MLAQNDQTIHLADGRTLGYIEYGDPQGAVVFFHHGQPGNRLFHPDPAITKDVGLRLVIPDRPGYGLSSFYPERAIMDWPKDLLQLADALDVEQFGLIGFSAGGPYALACVAASPEKITRLVLISSAPPLSNRSLLHKMPFLVRFNYWTLHLFPRLFSLSFQWYWTRARKNPHQFIKMAKAQSSPADRMALEDKDIYQMVLESWKENLRIDSKGYTKDAEILLSDWGFDLKKINTEVLLWWGEHDHNSPSFVQEYFAAELPHSQTLRQANSGHFGFLQAWEKICRLMSPHYPPEVDESQQHGDA